MNPFTLYIPTSKREGQREVIGTIACTLTAGTSLRELRIYFVYPSMSGDFCVAIKGENITINRIMFSAHILPVLRAVAHKAAYATYSSHSYISLFVRVCDDEGQFFTLFFPLTFFFCLVHCYLLVCFPSLTHISISIGHYFPRTYLSSSFYLILFSSSFP